ncbi:MAG: carboxylic ester hydrolase [Streptosporangiales bacterium]|nr:carboxylic ester hydrolase [Streptosporangiales bacterium]
MRAWEIVLVTADLLAFCVVVAARLRVRAGYLAATAPVAAVVQALVEGPRWQLIPAYLAAALFAAICAVAARRARRTGAAPGGTGITARRWGWRVGRGLGGVAGAVLLVVSVAVPVALPVFRFPAPSGPYGIGTATYHWVDETRPELFTADPGDRRELKAQVWYPAAKGIEGRPAPYIRDADAVTPVMARLFGFPEASFAHFKHVTTNAVEGAPAAPGRHPVLIFLSGLNGFRSINTFQIEELVSHGYVVVGLDQPGAVAAVELPGGRTIPGLPRERIQPLITQSTRPRDTPPELNGTPLPAGIVPYFAKDAGFALDRLAALNASDPQRRLTGRLDLARAGVFGISLGGMTAAQACKDEPGLRACLIMDVEIPADVVGAGLRRPVLLITRDAATMRLERARFGGWSEEEIANTLGTMRRTYEDVSDTGYLLSIPGMFHLNFTDFPYWSPAAARLGLTGPIAGDRGFTLLNAYSLAFFDRHLRGRHDSLLEGPSPRFPEARFRVNPADG